jgi:hypothetical protein
MSAILYLLGLIMTLAGLALAISGIKNPGTLMPYGITLETAAVLFVGGVLTWGIGGVISAIKDALGVQTTAKAVEPAPAQPIEDAKVEAPKVEEPVAEVLAPAETPSRIRFNPFGRKSTAAAAGGLAAAGAASTTEAEAAAPVVKSTVDDTIAALEQAKADIANAVGGISTVTEPAVVATSEDEADGDDDGDGAEGELYVLEEREIRGRPARILSDNTVEAETDEGWMRFENLEHLNEYLDAMGEPA